MQKYLLIIVILGEGIGIINKMLLLYAVIRGCLVTVVVFNDLT